MPEAGGGGIFVSYRRQETSHLAGRLYDRLADRFGDGQVFIDVDAIELGVDFAEEISRAVATCQVLLAVIGPNWLTATDERGRRRLDDPDDIVRVEIEAALARDVRVIPILVEGAPMPSGEDLPESLARLARRNALHVRHESFRNDAGRLVTAIERVLPATSGTVNQSPPTAKAGAPAIPRDDRPGSNAPSETARKDPVDAAEVAEAVQAAHAEGFGFGQSVAREAPALWLEAVLARKPRMPSDLEARLLQDSTLPLDSLLHDVVRHALRRGFWDALESERQ